MQGSTIVLTLDQPIQSGKLYTFEVAGENGIFQNAEAEAEGNKITILTPDASNLTPQTIRYAWKDDPKTANARSLSGLPMSSFEMKVKK